MSDGDRILFGEMFGNEINKLRQGSTVLQNKVDEYYEITGGIKSREIDYAQYLKDGGAVYSNAYDAAQTSNGLVTNSYLITNPVDVFNTETGEYLHLSQEQLNDVTYLV